MKVVYSEPFKRDYEDVPSHMERALDKALKFLLINPRHSSLRVRKLPGTFIWYARITRGYRLTFEYAHQSIILRRVGTHNILDQERK